ncbi:GNAT family N-acetyltransferase [Spirillospora sp. NPDC029432]|uniref:GNAT family N-acetyltransferase n=1 Tax=Spirillospora sp. NPDC029432 TaxID=3154599 RepID=UPI003453C627
MVRTRLATPDDVPVLAGIARAAYAKYVPRIGVEPPPMVADFAAEVAAGDTWVAEDEGAVLGFAVLAAEDDHLLLKNVAVDPSAQGRGVGGALLGLAERRAREAGAGEIRLYTNVAMTENIAYYGRRGYVETHREEGEGLRRVFFAKRLGQE